MDQKNSFKFRKSRHDQHICWYIINTNKYVDHDVFLILLNVVPVLYHENYLSSPSVKNNFK